MLFVGGTAMCWAGVGLGLWTALRWNNLVVSGAVIVSAWVVALLVREQISMLGLPVDPLIMVGVCGMGLVFWWLSARLAGDDESFLLQHART
jgi:predicted signal transduction protein with EAL and GGDEF domain